MTPQQFISKWADAKLTERSGSHQHFLDLCEVLGAPKPADMDPVGDTYCFERGALKTTGGKGWADVWRKGFFAWEYKGKHKNLDVAYAQLQRYAPALDNPPLLVVSDMDRIEVHTNFTNTVHEKHTIPIRELGAESNLKVLRAVFSSPESLQPSKTKTAITEEAAQRFASLAQVLRNRSAQPDRVAHFLNRILFCLFAQHARLLPDGVVIQVLEAGVKSPEHTNWMLRSLFLVMKKGGHFGSHIIEWFNGSLFDSSEGVPLEIADIKELLAVANLDWSAIEPSIFGTLFERGMDPDKRAQVGAHYTDPKSIMRIVVPVVVEPLAARWEAAKNEIKSAIADREKTRQPSAKTKYHKRAQELFNTFLHELSEFRVLDPACGSGNFLYLALQALKDLEHRATLEAEQLGLEPHFTDMHVAVKCLHGIEVNAYAAELARVTVWIGELQWMLKHGLPPSKNPILKPLQTIERRDAIMNDDGTEAIWPVADVVIGNPPFLGDKKMMGELGERYVKGLRVLYSGRLPGNADLVTYWFEKARSQLVAGSADLVGLVATNSIRGGANRRVLDRICETTRIFEAWSDEDWINEGAAVRVSLICFGDREIGRLNGRPVSGINADLTPAGVDLTKARRLPENKNCCFYATVKAGSFEIDGTTAREWLLLPNPNGKPNSDVVKPWANAMDITRRPADKWVVDFGVDMSLRDAALYEAPFAYVLKHVKPERERTRRDRYRKFWWLFAEPIPGMRKALEPLRRFIATPALSKHRMFVWMPKVFMPDHAMMVIAREDDEALGVLQSRFHELWALRLGTSLEDRPRYTPTTTFETFPFPEGLTPNISAVRYTNPRAAAIADAAKHLSALREAWLNPPEWTERVPEAVSGFPSRVVPKSGHESDLKKRTLTSLYNERPSWLENAHVELDRAVAAAYGWKDYTPIMSDDEIISRLLKLNLDRAPDLFTSTERQLAVVSDSTARVDRTAESRLPTARPSALVLERRLAVVCTLVNRLADNRYFGRTKMAKLFYLADATENLELDTTYYRKAAGPLDMDALYNHETGLETLAIGHRYLSVKRTGRRIKYKRGPDLDKAMDKARTILGKKRRAVNRLVDRFQDLNTDQCEIVATLYACWSDLLLEGKNPSEAMIIDEFLEAWHESKRRFPPARLHKALAWMKRNELVPKGRGAHTQGSVGRRTATK